MTMYCSTIIVNSILTNSYQNDFCEQERDGKKRVKPLLSEKCCIMLPRGLATKLKEVWIQ